MIKCLRNISVALLLMVCQSAFAGSGLLFDITATGTSDNVNITLCLNGKGPLSCQNHDVSALTLSILTTVPNHTYPFAGIKINTPGYTIENLGVDCNLVANGYCLFSVSDTTAKTITLAGTGSPLYFSGIMTNLAVSDVVTGGFTQCFSDTYNIPFGNSASTTITATCTEPVLLVACMPVGSNTLTDAAMANSTDIFIQDPATTTASHVANGTQWYNSDAYSFGYAPLGATINRSSCDIGVPQDSDQRLCWHTSNSFGGFRCGSTQFLNNSTSWVRVVYQRPGPLQ